MAAFEAADLQFYSVGKRSYTTITASGDILKSMNLPTKQPISESIQRGLVCGPIQMLEELVGVQHELEIREIFALSLAAGDANMLNESHIESTRVRFMKSLSEKKLSVVQQEFVLSYQKTSSISILFLIFIRYLSTQRGIRSLILPNFAFLTDSKLLQLPLAMVRSIDLRGCISLTASVFESFSKELHMLEELNCANMTSITKIGSYSLIGTAESLQFHSLKIFNLNNCPNLADIVINAPHLTWLNIKNCRKILPGTVLRLVPNSTKLSTLLVNTEVFGGYFRSKNYSARQIGTAAIIALSSVASLQVLALSECDLSAVGARHLASNTTLQRLELSNMRGIYPFVEGLISNRTLQQLKMTRTGFGDTEASALAKNTYLEVIELPYNKITNRGLRALAFHCTAKVLDLSHNALIGDYGVDVLASNSTLTKLDLSNNGITNYGASYLARNTTLKFLNLSGNVRIDNDGVTPFGSNRTLSELDIRGATISGCIMHDFDLWNMRVKWDLVFEKNL